MSGSIPADAFTSFVEFLNKQGLRRVRGFISETRRQLREIYIGQSTLSLAYYYAEASRVNHHKMLVTTALHANKRSLLIKFKFYIISPLPI